MGVDFLDMNFRLEKPFRIKIGKNGMMSFIENRHLREMTAGDVCDFVEAQLLAKGNLCPSGEASADDSQAANPLDRPAPWCFISTVWPEVQRVLSDTLGVTVEAIRRESLLIKDLGMS